MEVVGFVGEQVLSLILGFAGGWAYLRYRYWKIKRYAPSAKIVSFHVSLTENDYQRLPKKEADVAYFTKNDGEPPDEQATG